MIRRILQIDGGGIRGIIPLSVLVEIEAQTGKPCWRIFSLMSGTSTGSIICGLLAAGVPAKVIYDVYVNKGKVLFKKNGWLKGLLGSKYDRSDMLAILYELVKKYGSGITMGDSKTKYLSAAFNRTSGRTHFQMSWDKYHQGLDIVQVISWSALSAVHYFGPILVPNYEYVADYQVDIPYRTKGAMFFDGGQGRNNCTIGECITTCDLNGFLDTGDSVHILSLGCGDEKLAKPYEDCIKSSKLSDLTDVITQAMNEGVYDQLHKAQSMAAKHDNIDIYRLDVVLTKDNNKLDALDKIPDFIKLGDSLKSKIPAIFKKDISWT